MTFWLRFCIMGLRFWRLLGRRGIMGLLCWSGRKDWMKLEILLLLVGGRCIRFIGCIFEMGCTHFTQVLRRFIIFFARKIESPGSRPSVPRRTRQFLGDFRRFGWLVDVWI